MTDQMRVTGGVWSPPVKTTLRQQRHRDMLAAIEEWGHASGADRAYWRGLALYEIGQFRFLYLDPERAAFERDVLRSRQQHKGGAP